MTQSKVRINKYLAACGYCSRRKADDFIKQGLVKINNKVITDFSFKVSIHDDVFVNGVNIKPKKLIYIVLNKPKDYICTVSDEKLRKTVFDLIDIPKSGLFSVGRLDRNTTGTLLITNDGILTHKLLHPSSSIIKVYHVTLDNYLPNTILSELKSGITIDNRLIFFDEIFTLNTEKKNEIIVSLHSGQYHIIKRIFSKYGYLVKKLDRISFAGIDYSSLKRGEWRYLTKNEVKYLYSL